MAPARLRSTFAAPIFAPMRLLLPILFSLTTHLATAQRPAPAPPAAPRAGVYRTIADYRHQRLTPAGEDIRYSAKREGYVVSTRRGSSTMKTTVPRDSVWGFVDDKQRLFRLQGPDEYRVEQPDTITVYSRNATTANDEQTTRGGAVSGSVYTATHYFFSRGISGRIFPLSEKYLREAFAAGNPAFVAALKNRPHQHELSSYDPKANAFYIVGLFRSTHEK